MSTLLLKIIEAKKKEKDVDVPTLRIANRSELFTSKELEEMFETIEDMIFPVDFTVEQVRRPTRKGCSKKGACYRRVDVNASHIH